MYGTLDISTSALVAQRTRLDIISANIANQDTILNADGAYEPFRRRFALLSAGTSGMPRGDETTGVHVKTIEIDDGPLRRKYEPDSPYADRDGYVGYPNINIVVEQMNAMEAARSYEANITAIEATKSMIASALQILT